MLSPGRQTPRLPQRDVLSDLSTLSLSLNFKLVVISAVYLVREESQVQRDLSRVIHPGRNRARAKPKRLPPLRDTTLISHKGSHTTGPAALEVSESKETLCLMSVN